LRPGNFSVETVSICMGDVSVRSGRNSPLLVHGVVPAGLASIVLPLGPPGSLILNGRASVERMATVYWAGATRTGANHQHTEWAVANVGLDEAELGLMSARSLPPREGSETTLLCDPDAWARAEALFRSAAAVAEEDSSVFEVAEARRSLRSSVLEAVGELIGGTWGGQGPRRLRSSPARERLVRAADEYIRANMGQPITIDAVADAVGVKGPALRAAFRRAFGITPSRYLLLRRLTSLRHAIQACGEDVADRRRLATAHGFWNLQRLGNCYRDLFGEPFLARNSVCESAAAAVR
jgi:AraC family transcriptional regulator, ethanolamine operon transcriptional activator